MTEEEYLDSLPLTIEAISQKYERETTGVIIDRMRSIKDKKLTEQQQQQDLRAIKAIGVYYTAKIYDEYKKVLLKSAEHTQETSKKYYDYRELEQIPVMKNKEIKKIVNEDYVKFQKEFRTKSKGFTFDGQFYSTNNAYRKAVNKAVQAVQSGNVDYFTQIRKTVEELGGGMKVVYPSGYSRRLDSAMRMNVLDGVREVNFNIREQQGKEFGADGYEISVHGLSAPDHVNIQGKQYSLEEYKQLNESLKRPIGTLNCHHFATPIILGISEADFTDKQLNEYAEKSNKIHDVNGKQLTGYETTQEQRKYELKLRKLKERQMALQRVGDNRGAKRVQQDIQQTESDYEKFSKKVGLRTKPRRASVPLYKRMPIND